MMSEHPPTPRLSDHARQRCVEMGITTKVVKQIVTDPARTAYPGAPSHEGGRMMISSRRHPHYLVVTTEDLRDVVTVLWRSEQPLTREEANRLAQEAC